MNLNRQEPLQRLGFSAFFQTQFQSLLATDDSYEGAQVARVLSEARGEYLVSDGQGTRHSSTWHTAVRREQWSQCPE